MTQKELEYIAAQKDILKTTIDKDWVLGHFLNAFYSLKRNKDLFVFKGGTCLKKCYFENYRFSEDLDFTLLDKEFRIDTGFIDMVLTIAERNSTIMFHLAEIKKQFHNDIQQGYEVKIKFWGADHKPNTPVPPSTRWQTSIKLDISYSEQMINKPVYRTIFHPYSDAHIINEIIPAYSLKEILAEKLRSLIQRNRPRDIYDIWFLMNNDEEADKNAIKSLLLKKAENKNIEIRDIGQFVNDQKYRKNKRAWEVSLRQHLPENALPDFDMVYSDLHDIVGEILKY